MPSSPWPPSVAGTGPRRGPASAAVGSAGGHGTSPRLTRHAGSCCCPAAPGTRRPSGVKVTGVKVASVKVIEQTDRLISRCLVISE